MPRHASLSPRQWRPKWRSGGFFIYALVAPYGHRVRYVGATTRPDHRWAVHLSDARRAARRGRMTEKDRWIFGLLAAGRAPRLVVLQWLSGLRPDAAKRAAFREAKWVARLRREGEPLFNGKARPSAQHLRGKRGAGAAR